MYQQVESTSWHMNGSGLHSFQIPATLVHSKLCLLEAWLESLTGLSLSHLTFWRAGCKRVRFFILFMFTGIFKFDFGFLQRPKERTLEVCEMCSEYWWKSRAFVDCIKEQSRCFWGKELFWHPISKLMVNYLVSIGLSRLTLPVSWVLKWRWNSWTGPLHRCENETTWRNCLFIIRRWFNYAHFKVAHTLSSFPRI